MGKEEWTFCPDCKTLTPIKRVKINNHVFLMCKVCNRILFGVKKSG